MPGILANQMAWRTARTGITSPIDPLYPFDRRAAEYQAASRRSNLMAQIGFDQAALSVEANRARAETALKALEAQGITGGAEYERLAAIVATGEEPKGNLLTKVLGWLDKPGQVIRYFIADMAGWDSDRGSEITAGDYWDIIMGRRHTLARRLGADVVGEDARMSGSMMLEHMGLDKATSGWAKFGRGLLSVGLEGLTDPFTYATFGSAGAGRQVLATGVKEVAERMGVEAMEAVAKGAVREVAETGTRNMARDIAERVAVRMEEARNAAAALGGPLDSLAAWNKHMPGVYGGVVTRAAADDILKAATREVIDETMDRWTPFVLSRDWANSALADMVSYSGTPAFLKGGAWLHLNPFGLKRGVQIPGTAGLGRKASRTIFGKSSAVLAKPGVRQEASGLRGFVEQAFAPWYRAWEEGAKRSDYRAYLRGIMGGDIKASAILKITEDFLPQIRREIGWEAMIASLHSVHRKVIEAAEGQGLDEAMALGLMDSLPAAVFERVGAQAAEQGVDEATAITALVRRMAQDQGIEPSEELVQAMTDFVGVTRSTIRRYSDMMHETGLLDPGQGLEDYFVHTVNTRVNGLLAAAGEAGVRLENPSDYYGQMLNQILDGTALRAVSGGKMGQTRFARPRVLGATADVLSPAARQTHPLAGIAEALPEAVEVLEDGVVLIDQRAALAMGEKAGLISRTLDAAVEVADPRVDAMTRLISDIRRMRASYMGLDQLEPGMMGAVQRLLEANPALKKQFGDITTFFEGSTMGALQTYLSSVSHALIERKMLSRMADLGLIDELPPVIDMQMLRNRIAQVVGGNEKLVGRIEKLVRRAKAETTVEAKAALAADEYVTFTAGKTSVRVHVSQVATARGRAKVQGLVNSIEQQATRAAALDRERAVLVARLTKDGRMSREQADGIVGGLLGEQGADVARTMRDEADDTLRREVSALARELSASEKAKARLAPKLLRAHEEAQRAIRDSARSKARELTDKLGARVQVRDTLVVGVDGSGELGTLVLQRLSTQIEGAFDALEARAARGLAQGRRAAVWQQVQEKVLRARIAWNEALATGDAGAATSLLADARRLVESAMLQSGKAMGEEFKEVKDLVLKVFKDRGVKVPRSWAGAPPLANPEIEVGFFYSRGRTPWSRVQELLGPEGWAELQERLAVHRWSVDTWLQAESDELLRPLRRLDDMMSAHKSLLDWGQRGRERFAFSTPRRQEKFAQFMQDEFGVKVEFTTTSRTVAGKRVDITAPRLVGSKSKPAGLTGIQLDKELRAAGLSAERARALIDASRPFVETTEKGYKRLGFQQGAIGAAIRADGEFEMIVPRAAEAPLKAGGDAATAAVAAGRLSGTGTKTVFDSDRGIVFAVQFGPDGLPTQRAVAQAQVEFASLPPEGLARMIHMAQQAGPPGRVTHIDIRTIDNGVPTVHTLVVADEAVKISRPLQGPLTGLSEDAVLTLKGMQDSELALADELGEMVTSRRLIGLREGAVTVTRQTILSKIARGARRYSPDDFEMIGRDRAAFDRWVQVFEHARRQPTVPHTRALMGNAEAFQAFGPPGPQMARMERAAWQQGGKRGAQYSPTKGEMLSSIVDPTVDKYGRVVWRDAGEKKAAAVFGELPPDHTGRFFLSKDGKSGFYIDDAGEIGGIFNIGDRRGALDAIMVRAKEEGGTKVFCFDTAPSGAGPTLPQLYARHGFVVDWRAPFDERLAPEVWSHGPKDVVTMKLGRQAVEEFGGISEDTMARWGAVLTALRGSRSASGAQTARALMDEQTTRHLFVEMLGEHEGGAAYTRVRAMVDARAQLADLARGSKAMDPQAVRVIAAHRAFREHAGSTARAAETLETIRREGDKMLAEAGSEAARDSADGLLRLTQILEDLMGGGKTRTGEIGPLRAESDKEVLKLMEEGRGIAQEYGLSEIASALRKRTATESMHMQAPAGQTLFRSLSLKGDEIAYKSANPFITMFLENATKELTALNTPAGLRFLGGQARAVMNWWKGMATVARPTFHMRNLVGGVWNNLIAQVRPQDYLWVRNKMLVFRRDWDELGWEAALAKAEKTWGRADRQVIEDFFYMGTGESSFARASFSSLDYESNRTLWQRMSPLSARGPLVKYGQFSMESVEDFLRMACFRRWHSEMGASTAHSWTLAVHFDYRNLTRLEEKVKSVVPFFVWTRRNLPLQLRALVERPDLFARYQHLMYGMNDNLEGDGSYDAYPFGPNQPSLLTATGLVVNADTPMWARMILSPDLPLNDLSNVKNAFSPAGWLNFITSSLGPQVTLPFKQEQQSEYGDVNAPAGLAQIIRLIDWLPGPNPLGTVEQGVARMNRGSRLLAETALPILGEYLRPWDADPARLQALGVSQEAGVLDPERFRGILLNLGRGFGLKAQTPSMAYSGAFDTQASLDELLKGLQRKGVLPLAEKDRRTLAAGTTSRP